MIELSEKTITTIEKLIKEDFFPSVSVSRIDNELAPEMEDVNFSRISSINLRRLLALTVVLFSDVKTAPERVHVLNYLLKIFSDEDLKNVESFIHAAYNAEKVRKNNHALYKQWYRGPIIADLLTSSEEPRTRYVNHCIRFGIIDMVGNQMMTRPLQEVFWQREIWFSDISWLNDEAKSIIAGYYFDAEAKYHLDKMTILRSARAIENFKEEAPGNCDFATFLTVAGKNYANSLFYYHMSNTWYNSKIAEDPRFIYQLDVWYISWFDHNPRRNDIKETRLCLNFCGIANKENRMLAKKYIHYLITVTNLSFNTIIQRMSIIRIFGAAFNDNFLNITQQQIIDFCSSIYLNRLSDGSSETDANNYVSTRAQDLDLFYRYLCAHDLANENPLTLSRCNWKPKHKGIKKRAVSNYVLMQIFRVLPNCPIENYRMIFLVIFDTGLRVNDAVSLRKKDLVVTGETVNGHFRVTGGELHYYCHKFNKESTVILSPSVAMMLDEYRAANVRCRKNPFFFPKKNSNTNHIMATTFSREMKRYFISEGVVNEDGSEYHFEAHALRHTIAVRMKNAGLPIEAITAQLEHQSIEMTYRYIDSLDDGLSQKNRTYVNSQGERMTDVTALHTDPSNKKAVMAAYAAVRAKMLPNGMCKRPSALKACPHYCSCINGNCDYFRTNAEYLPIHEEQLRTEKELLKTCTSEPERKTHEKTIASLTRIITSLKGDTDDAVSRNEIQNITEIHR